MFSFDMFEVNYFKKSKHTKILSNVLMSLSSMIRVAMKLNLLTR